MKLIRLKSTNGFLINVNLFHIMEVVDQKTDDGTPLCTIYLVSHSCYSHAKTFHTNSEELARLSGQTSEGVILSKAVIDMETPPVSEDDSESTATEVDEDGEMVIRADSITTDEKFSMREY